MNTDLITKLAKLANNNPNENEANAAARKVCRLLAEGEFKFNIQPAPSGKDQTWERKVKPNTSRYSDTDFVDIFNSFYTKYGENPFKERKHTEGSWEYEPKKEKRIRQCSKCGKDAETVRVTPVFVCNACEWTEYQSKRPLHKCECGNDQWFFDPMSNTYICHYCKRQISLSKAEINGWRMQ